jgi:hypothetical protein
MKMNQFKSTIISLLPIYWLYPAYAKPIALHSSYHYNSQASIQGQFSIDDIFKGKKPKSIKKTSNFFKEIYILGLANQNQINIIRKQLKLDKINIYGPKLTSLELNKLTQYISKSKLFKNVIIQDHCLEVRKKQLIFIYLRPNESFKYLKIIKRICHKIPDNLLNHLFVNDLNSIIDPSKLLKQIKNIIEWYYKYGNNHIYIKLKKYKSSIFIDINENGIGNFQFIEGMLASEQSYYKRIMTIKRVPIYSLFELMNFYNNSSFNLIDNYKDIEEIKSKRIVDTCRCEIENINSIDLDQKKNINIALYLTALPDKETYVSYSNLNLYFMISNAYNYLFNTLGHYFYNMSYVKYINNLQKIYNNIEKLFQHYHSLMHNHLLNDSSHINSIINLYHYLNFNLIIGSKDMFFIRHNKRHLDQHSKSIVIDCSLPSVNRFFELRYKDPWFKIYSDTTNFLDIKYYRQILRQQKSLVGELARLFKSKISDQPTNYMLNFTNFYIDSSNLYINLVHKLSKKVCISSSIYKHNYANNDILLMNYIINNYQQFLNFSQVKKNQYTKLKQETVNKFRQLNFLFLYDNTYQIQDITHGFFFKVYLMNLIPDKHKQYPCELPYVNRLLNSFNLNCISFLSINKKAHLNQDNDQFVVIDSSVESKNNYHLIPFKYYYEKKKYALFSDKDIDLPNKNYIYKLSIEYHKRIQPELSLFFSTYSTSQLSLSIKEGLLYNINKVPDLSLGCGLSINLPFISLPPVYISYYYKLTGNSLHGIYFNLKPIFDKNILKY